MTPVEQAVEKPKVVSVSEEVEVVVAKPEETEQQVATVTELPDVVSEVVTTSSETAVVASAVVQAGTVEDQLTNPSGSTEHVDEVSVDEVHERLPVSKTEVEPVPTVEPKATTEEPQSDHVTNADIKPDEESKVEAVVSAEEDAKTKATKIELKYKYAEGKIQVIISC